MDKLERVARAIAQNGFGRNWSDFLPVNANDTDQGDLMEYAQAAIAALEPMDKPRVKPLEWEMVSPNVYDALGIGILYRAIKRHDMTAELRIDSTRYGEPHTTIGAAKAAAQADYEARILAALEPADARAALERVRQEALREAAAACDNALAEMQKANPDRHDALPYIEDGCDACKEAIEALAQKDGQDAH